MHPLLYDTFLFGLPEFMGDSQRLLICSTWLIFYEDLCRLPASLSLTLVFPT